MKKSKNTNKQFVIGRDEAFAECIANPARSITAAIDSVLAPAKMATPPNVKSGTVANSSRTR